MSEMEKIMIEDTEYSYDPEREYIKDGHAYCKNCHERKDGKALEMLGEKRIYKVSCKCDRDREAKQKAREKQMEIERLKRSCFASFIQWTYTFENYQGEENQSLTIAKNFVKEYEEMKIENIGLIFYGSVGSGKTYLACSIANALIEQYQIRLAPFDIQELRDLMQEDELELDTLGDRKTALFVIISDTDDTFNFVVSIMYSQLFNLLCDKADDVYGGRLPVHVRCLLDEFANIGLIPKFEKLIATIRSREISASIILQAQSQLKAIYKDNADTIVGNCDSTLFLGGKEKTTLKELSETLGKETIDLYNTSETRSNQKSFGLNYQKTGKELMSQDEITVMDGSKCIFQLRGVRPFLSDKFDITKHKNYKLLEDYDKKNLFDIESYMKRKGKAKLNRDTVITRMQ